MKLFLSSLVLFSGFLFADGAPQVFPVPLEQALVVRGFDDNDRVQVTVIGQFADTCWKVGSSTAVVSEKEKTVRVHLEGYQYPGICLRMLVPYYQTLNVGLLEAGDYTIVDDTSKKNLGVLSIARGTNPGPDDFLYAPITDAYVIRDAETTLSELVLVGEFQDKCTQLTDVKIDYQDAAIVVQPIVERKGDLNCEPSKSRFEVKRTLKKIEGVRLLHVRALNGQAINKVIELY